jgi:hypothetical protein
VQDVKYFNYLGGMIMEDATCTHEITPRIAMAKASFNRKKALFTSKLNLTGKVLHLEGSIVWC